MKTRYELHEFLCEILGSRNVYFQPPESVKMKYPAIVYERTEIKIVLQMMPFINRIMHIY